MELSLFIVGISSNSRRKINLSWKNKKEQIICEEILCLISFEFEGGGSGWILRHLDWIA